MGLRSRFRLKKRTEKILACFSGSGVAIEHIMATEECNSQSAPIEENGENKKRKEKRARPPGTEVKPIRKVTRTYLREVNCFACSLPTKSAAKTSLPLTSFPLLSIV